MKNVKKLALVLGLMVGGTAFAQTSVEGKGVYIYEKDKTIICKEIEESYNPDDDETTVKMTDILAEASGNVGDPTIENHVIFGGYGGAYGDGTIVCKGGGLCAQVFGHQIFIYN